MTLKLSLFVLILFTLFDCKQKDSENHSNINTDSLAYEFRLSQRDSIYKNFVAGKIDTSHYFKLPVWDTASYSYGGAYVDTFFEGDNKFRIVSPFDCQCSGGNFIFLQQEKVGQWINTNLVLSDNIHGGSLSRERDVNNDGYKDITNETRFTQDVYFYNTKTKTFNDTSSANINPNWVLIDTIKNVFCDFQEFKGMAGQIHSGLYTFHNYDQYYLYNIELDNNEDQEKIIGSVLNKCINGSIDNAVQVEKTKFKNPIDLTITYDNYFDFKNYWTKRYKKLLAYR